MVSLWVCEYVYVCVCVSVCVYVSVCMCVSECKHDLKRTNLVTGNGGHSTIWGFQNIRFARSGFRLPLCSETGVKMIALTDFLAMSLINYAHLVYIANHCLACCVEKFPRIFLHFIFFFICLLFFLQNFF